MYDSTSGGTSWLSSAEQYGKLKLYSLPYSSSVYGLFEQVNVLPMPVLLHSGDSGHAAGRFDVFSADPHTILRTHGVNTTVTSIAPDGTDSSTTYAESPFAILDKYFPYDEEALPAELELPFTGGAMGYFGYELLHPDNKIESGYDNDISLPGMLVGIYDWALVADHQKHKFTLVMRDCSPQRQAQIIALFSTADVRLPAEFRLTSPFQSNLSEEQYLEAYDRIIAYINAGDCYQVNLSQRFSATCEGDSWSAFKRLQACANAPFSAYLADQDHAVMSLSPERFIKVKDSQVLTQPIKGTRPRSPDPAQDAANRLDLESSSKDRAENLMIVDLLRNDLGRVCDTGTVSVENLFETQSFTNVHHLVSTIKGRLQKANEVFNLLEACFPGGSITGTPKLRAMEIINELETRPRSVYCGAIGYIDVSGNMDSNICIRTLVRDGDDIHCWGGGGIVADSVGKEEYQETLDKISLFLDSLAKGG